MPAPTTTDLQPLLLHGSGGPNPTKVLVLLTLLKLPHRANPVPFSEVKSPTYTALNPNGRLPTLVDPNTNTTLWESGAIITYLIATYDTERKLSFADGTRESWLAQQWLYFQVSGQGPYYGQAVWFAKFAEEKVPFALRRYYGEVERVMGVLERVLGEREVAEDGGRWLVGGRASYADLSWLPYQLVVRAWLREGGFGEGGDGLGVDEGKYPEVKKWIDRMLAVEGVRGCLEGCEPFGGMLKGGQ